MKHLFFLGLIFLLGINLMSAQTEETPGMSKNNLYLEASTFLLINTVSVNIEKKLSSSKSAKIHWYGRAGLGYVDVSSFFGSCHFNAWGGLLGVTMLTGKGNNHFEVNGGAFLGTFKSDDETNGGFLSTGLFASPCDEDEGFKAIPIINLGYRYQKPEGGFLFRVTLGTFGLGIGLGHAF